MRCVVLTNRRARCLRLVKFLAEQQLLGLGHSEASASWGSWWDKVQRRCQGWLMSIWRLDQKKKWSDHKVTVRHKVRNTVRQNRIVHIEAKYRNFCCELGVITWKQKKWKKYLSILFGQKVTIRQQCDEAVEAAEWTLAYSPGRSNHSELFLTGCI